MKKSYIQEQSLQVQTVIDLGEINQLIDALKSVDEEATNQWLAKSLINKLETLRRATIEEARREFENMLERG